MGISPRRSGEQTHIPPDSPQNRWGDWITGLEGAGEIGGGVVAEIDSKAESANTGSGELAGDLTALEARVDAVETGKANAVHTHTSTQINDATNTAGMSSTQNGDRLVKTRADGRIYVLTDSITETPHAVNKGYVDGIAREKAGIHHTHISESISDATSTGGMANVDNGNRVVKTRADGRIYILTESVTDGPHAVNKGYVDREITGLAARLESIEQRLGNIESRLEAAGIPPAP